MSLLLLSALTVALWNLPFLIGFFKSAFMINPNDMTDKSYMRGVATWVFITVTLLALIRVSRGT